MTKTRNLISLKIDAIQDGKPISDKIIHQFELGGRDFRAVYDEKSNKIINRSNFVGIVRKNKSILISLPKHYAKIDAFNSLPYSQKVSEIRLITKSILEFNRNPEYRFYAKQKDIQSDFALAAFYRIYDYYQTYGLYHEERHQLVRGFRGNISWKKTLKRSQKILGGGNLIFTPFYVNKKREDENLITQAMIFAINYTVQLFSDFIDLPDNSGISDRGVDMNILLNKEKVISQLCVLRNQSFKDIDKALLTNLIVFLRQANENSYAGAFIKQYTYANLWEKAVERYLNYHFEGIDDQKLIFSEQKHTQKVGFQKISENNYNLVHPDWRLEPDHYWNDKKNNIQYIFDSKYYITLSDLNHKQLAYHFLFRNRAASTIDALIMPEEGQTKTDKYVELNDEWLPLADQGISILLTHLHTKDVLKCFVEE